MKKRKELLSCIVSSAVIMSCFSLNVLGTDSEVELDETNFPDVVFRSIVSNFDEDGDDVLSEDEIKKVTDITFDVDQEISLKGIEYFSELEYLCCNKVTDLDLSRNRKLTCLMVTDSLLTSLDLSKHYFLKTVDIWDNEFLTELNVDSDNNLEDLLAENNALESIDLKNCTSLKTLDLSNNELIDIKNLNSCTKLEILDLTDDNLPILYLNKNTALKKVELAGNPARIFFVDNPTLKTGVLNGSVVNDTYRSGDDTFNCKRIWFNGVVNGDYMKVDDTAELICVESTGSVGLLKNLDDSLITLYWSEIPGAHGYEILTSVSEADNSFDDDIFLHVEDTTDTQYEYSTSDPDLKGNYLTMRPYVSLDGTFRVYGRVRFSGPLDGSGEIDPDTPTPVPSIGPDVTQTPTGAATPAVSVTPTPEVTGEPDQTDPRSGIREFVNRIYTYVLNREPEKDGADYWCDELYNFRRTGAEVAQGFIFSPEFESRNTSNEVFITVLYRTFFDREPEPEGMNFWLGQINTGRKDRATVANDFIFSQEWADKCAEYGIRSGGEITPSIDIQPTDATYSFVERMYTTAMNREYDRQGREYWAARLANFEVTGEQVGAMFFLSDEMTGYKLSDSEYLNRLYKTFMDREADNDGKDYWLKFIKAGHTREEVVYGFTRSPEFTQKCVDARILPF